jgi:hypothetical protein
MTATVTTSMASAAMISTAMAAVGVRIRSVLLGRFFMALILTMFSRFPVFTICMLPLCGVGGVEEFCS